MIGPVVSCIVGCHYPRQRLLLFRSNDALEEREHGDVYRDAMSKN